MKRIYFDCNATTLMKPAVKDVVMKAMDYPYNASSTHKIGREARRIIEDARNIIAESLNAESNNIIFTSGATESNNTILSTFQNANYDIITTPTEHPSIIYYLKEPIITPVLDNGLIDLDALDKILSERDKPSLLSFILVNNETGVIQPVEEIVKIAKKYKMIIHLDAVQAIGKIEVDFKKLDVDFISIASHKIAGPQGIGAIITAGCKQEYCLDLDLYFKGGQQEKNRRAGTESVALIAGFGKAMELAVKDLSKFQDLSKLRDKIETKILEIAPEAVIFGKTAPRSSNTTCVAIPGIASMTQLIALDLENICVSSGSACSSGTSVISRVLSGMGAHEDVSGCAIRISLGWQSTIEEVDYFLQIWQKMYNHIKS